MSLLKKPYVLFILLLVVLALGGQHLSPNDPYQPHIDQRLLPPSSTFLFGTDELGRCMFSRLICSVRVSLGLAASILAICLLTGACIGMVAGYFGGLVDEILMRVTDTIMALPSFIVAMVLIGTMGAGIGNMIFVFALTGWTRYARLTRSLVLSVKNANHVVTARLTGLGSVYILRRYILPAIARPLLVLGTLGMGMMILMTSSLSFLGLGITEPTPDWGAMMTNGTTYIRTAAHLAIFPGILICLTVLSFNLLGEALKKDHA
ncbi:nickel ABC transporter permease subunit NikC [Desulfosarcina ovata subsp. sediminis]|uniref:Nickel ABC transporter permease subunit NikC n=1 Tax=Desulfosarcina ovata subsp. sediminis TaxID=885957 RepID=A0A5K7ZLU8_9BACT|nr:ABC transporter permease subunit [Desulfosarcina ovata]BBO82444.1 nickel ABC transporter permease subunit NikC [Desulfosarcina ovata subsp. sediminis]